MRLCYEFTIANIEIYEVMKRLVKKTILTLNYNDLVHLLIDVFLLTKNNSQIILSTTKYKTYFH
jgi:hypothetical protein